MGSTHSDSCLPNDESLNYAMKYNLNFTYKSMIWRNKLHPFFRHSHSLYFFYVFFLNEIYKWLHYERSDTEILFKGLNTKKKGYCQKLRISPLLGITLTATPKKRKKKKERTRLNFWGECKLTQLSHIKCIRLSAVLSSHLPFNRFLPTGLLSTHQKYQLLCKILPKIPFLKVKR